ncbi:MAG: glycine cleavage system protein GcvH [Spirochaetales bacterium]|jgi:glycine cleavage system H protein|nr:glycine cleavage system protein GcvH [Spirochaetales bacterium]
MSNIPSNLRYAKEHEWVRIEGDLAYVGITDYAQETLGEIVYVELPPVGESYAADEEIANVESVKAASAIYSPISGVVAEVNEDLDGSPDLINEDSYANHLFVLKEFNLDEYEELLDAEAYGEYIKTLE